MPTYQYVCTECGEPLEVVQKFSDDALTECPNCSGKLRKVFSAAGIIFKGSGFYRTDSRGSGKSSSTVGASSSSNGKSESSSGGSSDSSSSSSSSSSSRSDSSSSSSSSGGTSSSGGSSEKVA
ncbi:FmdB family transcriptional regulator [Actinomadura barringtoniae]|uniref:FmdB family transcriptional regulator n=1 Tax=Actinomadura barringtoniae TaxID=1427535 RepID=A0A939T8Q9_9ACTN|nr:FmdB family zinc ribbon protein [Actinomadura barringtoniae]MBO2447175.1 FmdB family transcriptional regulator [Actinomadura barringtoniae]